VQELRGKPPPKIPDKDMHRYMREITSQGWVVEKTGGNHLKVWGPAGEGPYVLSLTPSSSANKRQDPPRPHTSDQVVARTLVHTCAADGRARWATEMLTARRREHLC
jgi:hypothetical protein